MDLEDHIKYYVMICDKLLQTANQLSDGKYVASAFTIGCLYTLSQDKLFELRRIKKDEQDSNKD